MRVASQDSYRITNQNLLNVGPQKVPRAKPKVKRELRFFVDKEFFKQWAPVTAYVLGYFTADDCMFVNRRGFHSIEFSSTEQ